MLRPLRHIVLILVLCPAFAGPALADSVNLSSDRSSAAPGPAARLVLAQRSYQAAIERGDARLLVAAIRLARSVTLRPATGWSLESPGAPAEDQPVGRTAAPDPTSEQALAIAKALAGEDPELEDLVYDIDAQLPVARHSIATESQSEVSGGQSDVWRMALSGDVAAEIGLIGDGDTDLGLVVTDESGRLVCAVSPTSLPSLCRFTPARNGFFNVTVANPGAVRNSYRLIGS